MFDNAPLLTKDEILQETGCQDWHWIYEDFYAMTSAQIFGELLDTFPYYRSSRVYHIAISIANRIDEGA